MQAYRRYAQTQGSGGGQTASRRGSRGGVRQRKRSQSKRKDTLSTSARSNEDMNMLNGKENRDISNASRSSEEEASSSPLSVANKYKDVHDGKPHQQYNQDQDDTVQSIVNSIHHQHYVQEQARRFRGTRKAIKSLQAHIRTQQAQASSMKKLGVIKQLQRLSRTILRRKMHQRLCKATAILQAKLRARVTVEWANDYIKATQVLQAHVRRENARKTCASMLFVVDKLQQCAKVRAVRKGYLAKLSAIAVLQAYAHGKFARRAFEVWLNRQNHRLKLDILHMWNAHQTSYLYRSFYWMQCVGDSINDRFCADGSTGSQGSGKGDRTDSKRESKSTHVKSSPLPSSSSSASLLSPSCKTLSLHRQELRRLLKLSPSSPSSRGAFRLDSDLFSEKHLFFAHLRQIPDTLKALVYRECGVNHRGKRRKERLWQALWNGRLCSGGSSWSSGHGLTGRVHEKNMDIERDYDDAYTSYHTTLGDDDDLSKLGCGGGRTSGGAQRKAMAMEMKEAKILQLQRHRDSIINDVEASSCYADVIRDGDYYSSISSTSHFTSSNLMRDAELSTKVLLTLSLAQRLNEEKRISSSNAVTQGVDFAVLYSHLLRFMNKLDDRDFNYYTRKTQILHEKGWLHKYQRWLPSSPSSLSLVLSPRFDGSGRSKYQCHQQQQYQTLVLLGIMMSINKVKLTYH